MVTTKYINLLQANCIMLHTNCSKLYLCGLGGNCLLSNHTQCQCNCSGSPKWTLSPSCTLTLTFISSHFCPCHLILWHCPLVVLPHPYTIALTISYYYSIRSSSRARHLTQYTLVLTIHLHSTPLHAPNHHSGTY